MHGYSALRSACKAPKDSTTCDPKVSHSPETHTHTHTHIHTPTHTRARARTHTHPHTHTHTPTHPHTHTHTPTRLHAYTPIRHTYMPRHACSLSSPAAQVKKLTTALSAERSRREAAEQAAASAAASVAAAQLAAAPPAARPPPLFANGRMSAAEPTAVVPAATALPSWYFLDASKQVRGPYDAPTMKAWQAAGYFPPSTQVRNANHPQLAGWTVLSQLGAAVFS